MALNRDKFRRIVGGITTDPEQETPAGKAGQDRPPGPEIEVPPAAAEQGGGPQEATAEGSETGANRRFAKRGRPRGRKDDATTDKPRKVKVSLFLSETLVNDLYDWAYDDRLHPGEMFERALKPFHEKESRRRKTGKG